MSDLADLAFDVAGELPSQVRKVIDSAVSHGWELNKPGMTLALRLNHPTDELAQPVYIVWAVGRTPTGRLSFKFSSCGTAGLVPLSGADLLEYLADPTTVYASDDDIAEAENVKKPMKWDDHKTPERNTIDHLGGELLAIEVERKPYTPRGVKPSKPIKATPLRIQVPTVSRAS